MKRLLLVTLGSPFLNNQLVFPYLGPLYMLSTAKELGARVGIIFSKESKKENINKDIVYLDEVNFLSMEEILSFDYIGISCITPQAVEAYNLLHKIKCQDPKNPKIIIGGPHAKYYYEECRAEGFDYVVVGDGEPFINDFIKNDCVTTYSKIDSLNTFPVPFREKGHLEKYRYILDGKPATTIMTARGCPNHCAFCEHGGTKVQRIKVNKFAKEVEDIIFLGFRRIMIFDDIYSLSPDTLKEYSNILRKYYLKYNFKYRCFTHAGIVWKYPEVIDILKESGCISVGFGAESASQRILDSVNKNTQVEWMHNLVEKFIKNGIDVKAFFMLNFPGETEEDVSKTIQFIKFYRNKYPYNFFFDLCSFFPYKGCRIGDSLRKDEKSYGLKLKDKLTWKKVDMGEFGTYKGIGGSSDIITESYDWENEKVLLSEEKIKQIQEECRKI